MCRLFGLSAGGHRVQATFWLLDAPDSLRTQSHRNPDGTGLGTFDEAGRPVIEKQPLAAFDDQAFATEAKDRWSSTFLAHVRKSSGTPLTMRNTHPFELDGRVFAHNGVLGNLRRLEAHLGRDLQRVLGDTDSERMFALITREIDAAAGDVRAGIVTAMGWIGANLPVASANFIMTTGTDLWALRWPAHHELWLSDRRDPEAHDRLEHHSRMGTRVRSDHLSQVGSVVVASERMDVGHWRLLEPGELVHVDAGLDLAATRLPHVGSR